MVTGYLEKHGTAVPQWRAPRRSRPTGAIVVHTAEIMPDTIGPDGGAEAVARFMQRRTDPGSYHDLVDSDGVLSLVSLGNEAFHDGTGGNRWSTSISFATRAADWSTLAEEWISSALEHAARAAVRHSAYVRSVRGFDVPARRITAAEYRAGMAGFISHGELDPGRRTDPGPAFPWARFLGLYARALAATNPQPSEEDSVLEDQIIKAFLDGGRDPRLITRDEVWAWRVEAIRTGRPADVAAFITYTEQQKH